MPHPLPSNEDGCLHVKSHADVLERARVVVFEQVLQELVVFFGWAFILVAIVRDPSGIHDAVIVAEDVNEFYEALVVEGRDLFHAGNRSTLFFVFWAALRLGFRLVALL